MAKKTDGKIQIIRKAVRPEYAVLPWKDSQAMRDAPVPQRDAGRRRIAVASEDAVDAAAMDAMYETDNGETFPAELLKRLLAGDNPVRVYREYRELTGAALAGAAGISQSYLSQIETGKRGG